MCLAIHPILCRPKELWNLNKHMRFCILARSLVFPYDRDCDHSHVNTCYLSSIQLFPGRLNCASGAVGVDTYGWGISQTLKDGEYILPGISRGGLLFQGQGNELVVTLTRPGRLHGRRKPREDIHPMIGVRYCWVVFPVPQPRRTNVVWRVEDNYPDSCAWKFTGDAYPVRSLSGIEVCSVYADGPASLKTRSAYVLDFATITKLILVAPPDLRDAFLEGFCECRL